MQNWQSHGIGNCWGMALSQREMFYLSRFNVQGAAPIDPNTSSDIVAMVGGDSSKYKIYSFADPNIDNLISTLDSSSDSAWQTAIEGRQKGRFYNPGSLRLVFGGGARSGHRNSSTMSKIQDDLSKGRMPLLILRISRMAQHAVLVRQVEDRGNGTLALHLYDSNAPRYEMTMIYDQNAQEFYYPDGLGEAMSDEGKDPNSALGVFISDEGDMDRIQKVTYDYYSDLCSKMKKQSGEAH